MSKTGRSRAPLSEKLPTWENFLFREVSISFLFLQGIYNQDVFFFCSGYQEAQS